MTNLPRWAEQGRAAWANTGQGRPAFAEEPGPDQESVWDYPRPPVLQPDQRLIEVRLAGEIIAKSSDALRLLETASPPTFYLPKCDVEVGKLEAVSGGTRCEWKGTAQYFDILHADLRVVRAAWSYPDPFGDYQRLDGYIGFHPQKVECYVDGVRVVPQPGAFYAGWITPELVGPFKGEPGSEGW